MTDLHDRMKAAGGGLPPAPFTIDDLTCAGRRRVRRRRWLVGSTGAAAVLAVVGTAVALSGTQAPPPATPVVQPAAPAAKRFTATFQGYRAGAFRVADPAVVTPGYTSAGVWRDGDHVGLLTAYRAGVYRPEAAKDPIAVDINGKRGIRYSNDQVLGARTGADRSGPTRFGDVRVEALAWEIAADTWATLESFGPEGDIPAASMRELANRFRTSGDDPARLPYRVGYLPKGYELVQAGTWGRLIDTNDGVLSGSVYHRGAPAFAGMTGIFEFEGPSSAALLISVSKSDPPAKDTCGRATATSGVICIREIQVEGFHITVDDRTGNLSGTEVEKVIKSITVADLGKPASWFPAAR
jgi:hypothetical protein